MSDRLADGLNGVFTPNEVSEGKADALKYLQDLIKACADINKIMMDMAHDPHVMILHSPTFKKHLEFIDRQLEAIAGLKETIERL